MNSPAVIGVVGMLLCVSSSAGAALMMGGEDKEATTGTGANTTVASTLPSGQFVKLEHTVAHDPNATGNDDDKHKILNLAEVEVFAKDGTTSLASGKTVTGTSLRANFPGSNLVDGNFTNFAHTWGRDVNVKDEFTIDLGSVQEIEKIKITNRVDCCKARAQGIKAIILGADGTTVVKETPAISTTADTYTFTFPGTTWA